MDYKDFYNLFLLEMPIRLNGGNPFSSLSQGIDLTIEYGGDIKSLGNNIYRVGDFFWVGSSDGKIKKLCANISIIGNLAKVNATGKNPELVGEPPYAADFYLKISKTFGKGIKFSSDQVLSDDGFKIWANILKSGQKILIFNNKSGKYSPKVINNVEDLSYYFNDSGHIYQYVLAESANIGNLVGHFTLMEWKRLAGYPLFELFDKNI